MNTEVFIEQKAKPLVFYVNQLLAQTVPFSEVKLFVWDILEEWNKLDRDDSQPSDYERVFWHLLYLIQCWPEDKQSNDQTIALSLNQCCDFLTYQSNDVPINCIGVRP